MLIQEPDGRIHDLPLAPRPRWQTLLTLVCGFIQTYQAWNAVYLDPARYGRLPHCYATLQGVSQSVYEQVQGNLTGCTIR